MVHRLHYPLGKLLHIPETLRMNLSNSRFKQKEKKYVKSLYSFYLTPPAGYAYIRSLTCITGPAGMHSCGGYVYYPYMCVYIYTYIAICIYTYIAS